MITNKNHLCVVHTQNEKKSKSVYDDYKTKNEGIIQMVCKDTLELIPVVFKTKRQLTKLIKINREIKRELRMVS